jgi:anti-repressor protein
MNELIKTHESDEGELLVSGRELHEFLEVGTAYKDWFPRMKEYGFEEGVDFCSNLSESTGGRPSTDHHLKLPMAKEIAMIQRTDRGKQARQYFIKLEQAWNTPEMIMARALKMAEKSINSLKATNSQLTVQNTILEPKAAYFDELVNRNLLTNFRDAAKELKIAQKTFVTFLLEHKFIYRDSKGQLKPFASHEDLFEIKETLNGRTGWVGTQTLITPKGRETFRLLMIQ